MAYDRQDYLVAGLCLYEIDRVQKQLSSAYLLLIHVRMKCKYKIGMMCKPQYFTIISARTDQLKKCCLLHLLSDTLLYTLTRALCISLRQMYLIHRSVPRPNKTRAVPRLKVRVCSLLRWMLRSCRPLSALPSQCLPATRSLAKPNNNLYSTAVDI